MSDSESELYARMAAQATEIAATEVVTWVPAQIDDHVCGRVIDTGTIELPSLRNTGEIDIWPTNTIEPIGEVVMEGKTVDTDGKVIRVAWLGPVQLRHYERTLPDGDDVIAMHYQSDQTPRTAGYNDYKLVNCVVFDHNTGAVKRPRVVPFGATRDAIPADSRLAGGTLPPPPPTGIHAVTGQPVPAGHPLADRGEEPL